MGVRRKSGEGERSRGKSGREGKEEGRQRVVRKGIVKMRMIGGGKEGEE